MIPNKEITRSQFYELVDYQKLTSGGEATICESDTPFSVYKLFYHFGKLFVTELVDIFAVEPKERFKVENCGRFGNAVDSENVLELVKSEELGFTLLGTPTEKCDIVDNCFIVHIGFDFKCTLTEIRTVAGHICIKLKKLLNSRIVS